MKLAVDGPKFGKGFRYVRPPARVYMDGEEISGVVAVDIATGIAWRYARDAQGEYRVDRANECVVIERITGSFRVEPMLAVNLPSGDEE